MTANDQLASFPLLDDVDEEKSASFAPLPAGDQWAEEEPSDSDDEDDSDVEEQPIDADNDIRSTLLLSMLANLKLLLELNRQYQSELVLFLDNLDAVDARNAASRQALRQTSLSPASASTKNRRYFANQGRRRWEPASLLVHVTPGTSEPTPNPDLLAVRLARDGVPRDFVAAQWTKKQTSSLHRLVLSNMRQQLVAAMRSEAEESQRSNAWCVEQMEKIRGYSDEWLARDVKAVLRSVDWQEIAGHFAGRTGNACRLHWQSSQAPPWNQGPWRQAETDRLFQLAQLHHGHDWEKISSELGTNRSPAACFHHYQRRIYGKYPEKKPWSAAEDARLRQAVAQFGTKNWEQVANMLERRDGQQCLHRWKKALDPNIRHGRWSLEEDVRLGLTVSAFGVTSWAKAKDYIRGRTDAQIRERWVNIMDPTVSRLSTFTPEDDDKLRQLVKKHGFKWSEIARHFKPWTDNQLLRRWKMISQDITAKSIDD